MTTTTVSRTDLLTWVDRYKTERASGAPAFPKLQPSTPQALDTFARDLTELGGANTDDMAATARAQAFTLNTAGVALMLLPGAALVSTALVLRNLDNVVAPAVPSLTAMALNHPIALTVGLAVTAAASWFAFSKSKIVFEEVESKIAIADSLPSWAEFVQYRQALQMTAPAPSTVQPALPVSQPTA
jgi:hypothetical protein